MLPYTHCLLSQWVGGRGGEDTVLQMSSEGDDRMGPLFHVKFTWQLVKAIACVVEVYKRPAALNLFLVLC